MAKNNFAHLRQEHRGAHRNTVPATFPFAHLVNGAAIHEEGLTPAAAAIIAMGERIQSVTKEANHG